MNYLEFNSVAYRDAFHLAVADLRLSLGSDGSERAKQGLKRMLAMQGYIDFMQQLDEEQAEYGDRLSDSSDASRVGGMVLELLDDIGQMAVSRGLVSTMQRMQQMSLPVALWIARHQGEIEKLDIVVNAIAAIANEDKSQRQLTELCHVITQVQASVSEKIRRDVEIDDPMRPWKILNLNWGIVATRTLSPHLMEVVFEALIHAIPSDAQAFFQEGMLQMDIVGYPDAVREVMTRYNKLTGPDNRLH
ncbi:MAG: hypothetical protein OQL20_01430 [Sedimenticola sp.]|nr:hypothetical protein [Sedimenticola sp.]